MAQQQLKSAHRLDKVDPVWSRIRDEAEEVVRREPELSSFIYSSILHHDTLERRSFTASPSGSIIRTSRAN